LNSGTVVTRDSIITLLFGRFYGVAAVEELRAKLNKQTLCLPPLQGLCSDGPIEISPYYERLKETIETRLDGWITEPDVRMKARELDLAYLKAMFVYALILQMSWSLTVSSWLPHASFDRLLTMSWLILCFFIWDDGIEDTATVNSSEDGNLELLHQQALLYVGFHLGLSDGEVEPVPPTKYFVLFKYAAEPLRTACTATWRREYYQHLALYMKCCEVEHQFVRSGSLPTSSEYWEHRLGTAFGDVCSALAEYVPVLCSAPAFSRLTSAGSDT
jgi:hypothetical protein